MNRILLMGPPGSGKSTQGQMLADKLGFTWVSIGEILRSSKEPWVIEKLKTAELFDDQMIFDLLSKTLSEVSGGVVLDGWVRNQHQAEMAVLPEVKVDLVIEIKVPFEEVLDRLSKRGRDQDKEDIAKQRYDDYNRTNSVIIDTLNRKGIKTVEIDGTGNPEEVFARVMEVVEEIE